MKHRHRHNFNFIQEISKVTHEVQKGYPRVSHDLGSVVSGGAHMVTTVTGQASHSLESATSSLAPPCLRLCRAVRNVPLHCVPIYINGQRSVKLDLTINYILIIKIILYPFNKNNFQWYNFLFFF